jgi:uncharacterized membrane protein YbhN (UPF0104 family)
MAATTPNDQSSAGAAQMPEELDPRHLARRLVALALLVGLVAVAVGSLPGLGTLRSRFARADVVFLVLIGLLKLGSCLSNVVAFRDVFCKRMSWRFSYQLGMAEQATNVLLPTGGAGGLALGVWALRQGGMPTEHIARRSVAFFVLTSIPNFACAAVLGLPPADGRVLWTCADRGDSDLLGTGMGYGGTDRRSAARARTD